MLVSQKHEIDKGGPGGQQSIALDGCMIAVTCEMTKPIPDKAPPPYGFFSINSNRHKTGSDSAIDPRYLPTYLPTYLGCTGQRGNVGERDADERGMDVATENFRAKKKAAPDGMRASKGG